MSGSSLRVGQYPYLWLIPAVIILLTTLLFPFSYDNATYQTMAWQMVNEGKLPYVGTWDQNFPAIVYVHALAILVFGNGPMEFHAFDAILQLLTAVVLHRVTARYFSESAANIAALFYVGAYVFYGIGMFGQRDVYAGSAILISLWLAMLVSEGKRGSLLPILSGAALGAACLFRPTYVLCVVGLLWLLVRAADRVKSILLIGLGAIVVVAVGLWPYLFDADNFREFYLATFAFNMKVYGAAELRDPLGGALYNRNVWVTIPALLALAVTAVLWHRDPVKRDTHRTRLSIATVVITTILLAIIFWMGKHFSYHYFPLFLLLSPFVGYGLQSVASRVRSSVARRAVNIGYAVILLALALVRNPVRSLAAHDGTWHEWRAEINDHYNLNIHNSYATKQALVDYIRRNTSSADRIETCSMDNEIIWQAERSQASRFTLIHPLGIRVNGGYADFQLQWRQEFVDGLRSQPPKLLLLNSGPQNFLNFLDRNPEQILRSIPGFEEVLARNFVRDTVIGTWSVYKRR